MSNHITKKAMPAKKEVEKKFISIFASQQWIKASKVLEEAEKQNISSSTVFRWLKKLAQEGVLEKYRKSSKDSSYRLSQKTMPKEMWEETILKFETLSLVNENLREFEPNKPQEEIFKELSQWLGALSLYSAFIAAKKGRASLMDVPTFYVTESVQTFVKRLIAYKILLERMKTKMLTPDEYIKTVMDYQNPLKALDKEEIAQPALIEMKEAFEKAFGKDRIQQLENVFDKVLREGKSKFQLLSEKELLKT